jgi:hypothetical protein
MNPYLLFIIVPFSMIVGGFLAFWYMTHQIKKAMGIKS